MLAEILALHVNPSIISESLKLFTPSSICSNHFDTHTWLSYLEYFFEISHCNGPRFRLCFHRLSTFKQFVDDPELIDICL